MRLTALSAGGIIAYVLCMNFASIDWVMSLDPKWYSTIFVEIFIVGHFLSALALVTALLALFARHPAVGDAIPAKAFHDLGNMLLAFVIFWTYVTFSQFLIIWSGNLPKEIGWYLDRSRGGWQWFAGAWRSANFSSRSRSCFRAPRSETGSDWPASRSAFSSRISWPFSGSSRRRSIRADSMCIGWILRS